ncbi:MAG: tRNA pseudouridine(38-40) synthase TruA [candidate division WOR-3 bacterium]
MPNIRLTIEFDGTNYAGWQIQPKQKTIQGLLEASLKKIFGQDITVYGCGRTDAGVSARNYVANCHCPDRLSPARIAAALNFYLPSDIFVKSAEVVSDDFHARYSAITKTYTYSIICNRSPLRSRFAWEVFPPLDIKRLEKGAKLFLGKKDFNPFCAIRSGNGICTIRSIHITKKGDEILIKITGDRFLYKMVRRIVGALVAYATGRITVNDIRAALAGKKGKPFTSAPAQGLILERVEYPKTDKGWRR